PRQSPSRAKPMAMMMAVRTRSGRAGIADREWFPRARGIRRRVGLAEMEGVRRRTVRAQVLELRYRLRDRRHAAGRHPPQHVVELHALEPLALALEDLDVRRLVDELLQRVDVAPDRVIHDALFTHRPQLRRVVA